MEDCSVSRGISIELIPEPKKNRSGSVSSKYKYDDRVKLML